MGIVISETAKEILVDCVVKPVIGACVSVVAMAAAGKACEKVQAAIENRKERKKEETQAPKVKGLLA